MMAEPAKDVDHETRNLEEVSLPFFSSPLAFSVFCCSSITSIYPLHPVFRLLLCGLDVVWLPWVNLTCHMLLCLMVEGEREREGQIRVSTSGTRSTKVRRRTKDPHICCVPGELLSMRLLYTPLLPPLLAPISFSIFYTLRSFGRWKKKKQLL